MNEKIHGRRLMIILICMASQAIPFTIAQSIQPLFVPYVVKTFDFSLASYSLIFTFGAVSSAIISPMIGKILPKINFRVIYLTGIILSAIAFAGFGLARSLPQFYAVAIFCMIGSVFFSGQGIPWIINHWFPGKGTRYSPRFSLCRRLHRQLLYAACSSGSSKIFRKPASTIHHTLRGYTGFWTDNFLLYTPAGP